jgi:hypothetical protein
MPDTVTKQVCATDAPQRLGPLAGIPELLDDFGVPLESTLAGLPLSPEIFTDPERRIPYEVAAQILLTGLSAAAHLKLNVQTISRHLGEQGDELSVDSRRDSLRDGARTARGHGQADRQ